MTENSKKKTPVIDVLSLFPESVRAVLDSSILRRAQSKDIIGLESSDLRSFAQDKHRSVDDTPFGGQQGMLFKADVLEKALEAQLAAVGGDRSKLKIIYPHPRGLKMSQPVVQALADSIASGETERMVLICGRYEGIDERIVDLWVDLELSLGDFILTGGELPALAITDAVVRLLPGVLGDDRSAEKESFSQSLLEHPQYTKPREFRGLPVPRQLVGGNHLEAEEWKLRESLLLTAAFRPDLIREHAGEGLPSWARDLLDRLQKRLDLRGECPLTETH
ncbi:MAG: tRNA (guanosine(37)-N1)-methyltransferase TrmD [Bdellovibrionota bacterium]